LPETNPQSKLVSESQSNTQVGKKKTIRFVAASPNADESFLTESKSLDSENDNPKILNPSKLQPSEPVNMDTF
jgi:hypothetical protein